MALLRCGVLSPVDLFGPLLWFPQARTYPILSYPIDGGLLTRWLESTLGPRAAGPASTHYANSASADRPLRTDPITWEVKRSHIERAIEIAGNSAPGPDQIPYHVWRQLGALGTDTL